MKSQKMFAHNRLDNGKDEWLTPPFLIKCLGPFDLDPCSPITRPWDTAARHMTIVEDGLKQPWEGRVWLNPPYGTQTGIWLHKMTKHGNGIALIFARTETRIFREHIWAAADAILFMASRLTFHNVDGSEAKNNSGAPSALVAYGERNAAALLNVHRRFGMYIDLNTQRRQNDAYAASGNQRLL